MYMHVSCLINWGSIKSLQQGPYYVGVKAPNVKAAGKAKRSRNLIKTPLVMNAQFNRILIKNPI